MENKKINVSLEQALEIASSADKRATSLNNLCCDLMLENQNLKSKVKNLTIAIITLLAITILSIAANYFITN